VRQVGGLSNAERTAHLPTGATAGSLAMDTHLTGGKIDWTDEREATV
jgi:hypothetical protein